MATDQERLSKLEKAAEHKAATSTTLQPWQEFLQRHQAVSGARSLEAAEIIAGISGSWAAFFDNSINTASELGGNPISSPQTKTYKLGHPGLPEINFPPYTVGTNRFGTKGPGLIGHPISLSVVGPTLKSPKCDWQWEVTSNHASPGVGDLFTLDLVDSARSIPGTPVGPSAASIVSGYRIDPSFGTVEEQFPGGLYMAVIQTGDGGAALGGSTGLGDGFIGDGGGVGKVGVSALNPWSKFEIFRVIETTSTTLRIDPGKRFHRYFNVPANSYVRGIMLFEPHLTRLVSVPGSGTGTGKEQAFVVVPPERSATGDSLPPYITWITGGFDPNYPPKTGNVFEYNGKVALPIPRPLEKRQARAQVTSDTLVTMTAGRMTLWHRGTGTAPSTDDIGKVLRVYRTVREGSAPYGLLGTPDGDNTTDAAFLGSFEIIDVSAGAFYLVRRLPEVDPRTGNLFWGASESLWIDDNIEAGNLFLDCTLHDPISALHTSPYNDMDKVASARLTNLIDPSWVERSGKSTPEGVSSARADKAIWDTSSSNGGAPGSNADPGSLLDLGFRMVLYPAKEGTGSLFSGKMVPDYDNPITSREVVLDPSLEERQWIDIDYSGGVVTFSHPPVPGTGCDVAPNGIVASDNPRGELVLFAACVPYSQEEGQLGGGVRVSSATQTDVGWTCSESTSPPGDVYGGRVSYRVSPTIASSGSAPQVIASGSMLVLDLYDLAPDIPESGFLELRVGSINGDPALSSPGAPSLGLYGYTSRVSHLDTDRGVQHTRLEGVYGGGVYGVDTIDASSQTLVAVLRRDIRTPVESDNTAGTHYEHDLTYGFAKKSSTIRFRDTDLVPQPDGSLIVEPRPFAASATTKAVLEHLLSSGVFEGGSLYFVSGGAHVSVADTTVIIRGSYSIVPLATVTLDGGASQEHYIYVDSSSPDCPSFAVTTALPLPQQEDVLLYRVDTDGSGNADPTTVVDLRHPMVDIDLRADILVGEYDGAPNLPHYATLAEAFAFIRETGTPPSGSAGRGWRIKVIGSTSETPPATGIPVPLSNVEVTGVGPNAVIKWGSDSFLFDISGSNGLTFRGLTFEYENLGQPINPSVSRAVFYNNTAPAVRFTLDQIKVVDSGSRLHGLFYSISATGGLDSALFDEVSVHSTDFGLWLGSLVTTANNIRVQNSSFQASTAQAPSITGYAAVSLLSSVSEGATVRGSSINGYVVGARLEGLRGRVEDCTFARTRGPAVLVRGGSHIVRGNYGTSLHFDPASIASARCAVYVDSSPDTVVEHNDMALAGGVLGTDYNYIGTTGSTGLRVLNNRGLFGILLLGAGSTVVDNTVKDIRVEGDNQRVTDNKAAGDLLVKGDYGLVKDNKVDGGVGYDGSFGNIEGNTVLGIQNVLLPASAPATVSGSLVVFDSAGVDDWSTKTTITGNTSGLAHVRASEGVFSDNRTSGSDLKVMGNNLTVTGNHCAQLDLFNGTTNRSNYANLGNNQVFGNFTLDGVVTQVTFADNTVNGGVFFKNGPISPSIIGNTVGDGITVEGNGARVLGNHMKGTNPAYGPVGAHSLALLNNSALDDLASEAVVADNQMSSWVYIWVSEGVITGNHVGAQFDIRGYDLRITDNHINAGNLIVQKSGTTPATGISVIGNHTGGSSIVLSGCDDLVAADNVTYGILASNGSGLSLLGNRVKAGDITVITSAAAVIEGNHVDDYILVKSDTPPNESPNAHIKGNQVGGYIRTDENDECIIEGNTVGGDIEFFGNRCLVTGNNLAGNTINGDGTAYTLGSANNCTISNNIQATVQLPAAGSTHNVAHNTGNGSDWAISGAGCTIMGNNLGLANLVVPGGGSGGLIIIGNVAANIGADATGAAPWPSNTVALGNKVSGLLYGTNPSGAHIDPGAGGLDHNDN